MVFESQGSLCRKTDYLEIIISAGYGLLSQLDASSPQPYLPGPKTSVGMKLSWTLQTPSSTSWSFEVFCYTDIDNQTTHLNKAVKSNFFAGFLKDEQNWKYTLRGKWWVKETNIVFTVWRSSHIYDWQKISITISNKEIITKAQHLGIGKGHSHRTKEHGVSPLLSVPFSGS